jgi:hypothetical protein
MTHVCWLQTIFSARIIDARPSFFRRQHCPHATAKRDTIKISFPALTPRSRLVANEIQRFRGRNPLAVTTHMHRWRFAPGADMVCCGQRSRRLCFFGFIHGLFPSAVDGVKFFGRPEYHRPMNRGAGEVSPPSRSSRSDVMRRGRVRCCRRSIHGTKCSRGNAGRSPAWDET